MTVIPDMYNGGIARTMGGENLLFVDCYVCFDSNNINMLLETLDLHLDYIVGPAYDGLSFQNVNIKDLGFMVYIIDLCLSI